MFGANYRKRIKKKIFSNFVNEYLQQQQIFSFPHRISVYKT